MGAFNAFLFPARSIKIGVAPPDPELATGRIGQAADQATHMTQLD